MRTYTAHLRAHTAPVLLREGASFGALVFGPLWLLARRAWIAALLLLAAELLAGLVLGGPAGLLVLAGLVLFGAWSGHDLVRWHLERQGFVLAHVVAARNADAALARLLDARPDLLGVMAATR